MTKFVPSRQIIILQLFSLCICDLPNYLKLSSFFEIQGCQRVGLIYSKLSKSIVKIEYSLAEMVLMLAVAKKLNKWPHVAKHCQKSSAYII